MAPPLPPPDHGFTLAGQSLRLLPDRAVHWPGEAALVVADLHLEKASFFARTGQMLPPYDSRDTLQRLDAALAATGARRLYCLGDNFHDPEGPARLEPEATRLLADIARRVDIVWITGNHDEGLANHPLPGTILPELSVAGIALRHEAQPGSHTPEMSGHFHPRLVVRLRGRRVARPCAVLGGDRLILPAFGSLTGGLDASDSALARALAPARQRIALAATGQRLVRVALP